MSANSSMIVDIDANWLVQKARIPADRTERIVNYLKEEGYDTVSSWEVMPDQPKESDLNDKTKLKPGEYRSILRAMRSSGQTKPQPQPSAVPQRAQEMDIDGEIIEVRRPKRRLEDPSTDENPAKRLRFSQALNATEGRPAPSKLERSDFESERRAALPRPRGHVSLVMLGETGCGKTTLVQALLDFVKGVRFEDIQTTRLDKQVRGRSQTKKTRLLKAKDSGMVLTVIDTPGIGDTEGLAEDTKHMDNITEFLSNDTEFNAICVLIKDSTNRATARMEYVVGEMKAHLPKDTWKQVFTIVTRTNRRPAKDTVAVINHLGLPTSRGHIFSVDNYAYEKGANELEDFEDDEEDKRRAFDTSRDGFGKLLISASQQPKKTGDGIKQLRITRTQLKVAVAKIQAHIQNIQNEEQRINDLKADIENSRNIQASYENYTRTRTVVNKVAKEMPDGAKATTCGVCHNRCHDPCHLPTQGIIDGCACLDDEGKCNECAHHQDNHLHTNTYFEDESTHESYEDEGLKGKFESARDVAEQKQALLSDANSKLAGLQKEKEDLMDQMADLYMKIESMAVIGFNESFERYIEELIEETNKKPGLTRDERIRRVEELRKQLELFKAKKEAFEHCKRQAQGRAPHVFPNQRCNATQTRSSSNSGWGFGVFD